MHYNITCGALFMQIGFIPSTEIYHVKFHRRPVESQFGSRGRIMRCNTCTMYYFQSVTNSLSKVVKVVQVI